MVKNGEITLADAKRVLKRFWWLIPLCVIPCGILGAALATLLPKRYESKTLVLVQQPTVPADYVKPVVTEGLNERLASMQEQILSRSRLEPIIEKFGLYGNQGAHIPLEPIIEKLGLYRNQGAHIPLEELVARLRSSVTIAPVTPMPGTRNQQLPGFYVSVTFSSPRMAQQICTEITSMFMEQNSKAREQQALRTTSFLGSELAEAKAKLDAQDARLAEFKRRYLGELPEQAQTNLSLLMGLNTQLEANSEQLDRAQQARALTQSLLTQQEANWKASKAGQNPVTREQQLSLYQAQLADLQAHYTLDYPDVIKLNRTIEELKKQIQNQPTAMNVDKGKLSDRLSEPANIQELRVSLRQTDLNIAELTKKQAQIQEQIRVMEQRVQASPMVEQQFKELTRDYQTALDFYNELLRKRENSAMATNLEQQQESEQFRVLDPPSLPSAPSFPRMSIFAGGGAGAGFVLSLGLLFLLANRDTSLYTEKDVELCLKLPVLTLVPWLDGSKTSRAEGSLGVPAKPN